MIWLILIPTVWFLGAIGFYLWECYHGWGVDWDDYYDNPLFIAAIGWFIAVPILVIMNTGEYLEEIKKARKKKEEQAKRMRIVLEQEEKIIIQQVEEELERDRKSA